MAITNLVMPKIESTAMTRKYGRFTYGPLERGFGITIGNSLRRVLLSSLPGAAVTSIRVADAPHEFSAIPYVREDMMQLILQIKQLRVMLHNTEMSRLRLEVHGAGTSRPLISCCRRKRKSSTLISTCSRLIRTMRSSRSK